MKQKIAILNLGYGNIASIINAVEYLGFKQKLEKKPQKYQKLYPFNFTRSRLIFGKFETCS